MKNNNEPLSSETVSIQSLLRPALTPVLRNRDHVRIVEDLQLLDQNLKLSGLESKAIELALSELGDKASAAQRSTRAEWAVFSLRSELLRQMLQAPSFESYSVTLSSSDLFSDFCGCRSLDGIRWTSKSTLHRASTFYSDEQLREFNTLLVQTLGGQFSESPLGLETAQDMSVCLIDSTCLEANIHFPVDWVLLRDVSLTLLKAVTLIRKEGLLCRMPDGPEKFIRDMNKLSIEMTHCYGKTGAKKLRKNVLRKMKRLLKTIGEHALRHRDKLEMNVGQTKLSQAQATRIVARIDQKLELLPKVIEQAHERIIGERPVKSEDKILSAHEREIDIIVRGKAGARVEFGNELFIAENAAGIIIDYKLYGKGAPSEGLKMQESVERIAELELAPELKYVVTDRGFDGKKHNDFLDKKGITSMVCPKSPARLAERLNEPLFRELQTRRGATEARIAIFKNHTGSRVWRAKGLKRRKVAVGWSVLAHNLEWVARTVREQKKEALKKSA